MAPDWAIPSGEVVAQTRDPWLRRLLLAGGGTLGVALVLYVIYFIVLRSGGGAA